MHRLKNHKKILRLAFPIILANASAPILGLVDTTAIGQTGVAADLGAVALATLVFSFVYWGFGFLRMGTTGFISQAHGANDREEVLAVLYRVVLLGLGIGVLLILLQVFIGNLAVWLMSASEEVKGLVKDYFYIRIWGAPATLITYALLGALIGLGWTKQLLWVQLALNGLNILLNILFVVGLDMGIKGIALGTLIAEWITLFFAWYLLTKNLNLQQPWQRLKELWNRIVNRAKIVAIFKVNADIMIRTFALLSGFAWFANQGAIFGDTTLAANHVLLQFVSMSAFFLDGFAHVSEMLSGKAIGAKDKQGFITQIKDSTQIAGVTAILLGSGIMLFAPLVISFITKDAQVQAIAEQHSVYAGIYIIVSFVAFQLDGVFIGATRSKEMRNTSIISLLVLIGAGTILTQYYGNIGLWISFIIYVIARGVSLGAYMPKLVRELF
ncbi:MAG TPA: MATE family efflux transporter [Flavobacteriaceae bacterium]|nr:MATE family efflux transporter [Flavobacteriaceae bacterium]